MSKVVLVSGIGAAAFMAAACGSAGLYGSAANPTPAGSPSGVPVVSSPSPSTQPSGTTIGVGSSRLGQVLVDSKGITLYLFRLDAGATSNCNSPACVQYWPPVLTSGAPQAGIGLDAALLGTTVRKDGTTQVTFSGHPLYYFLADKKPGDTNGQGVDGFGAKWWVVSPAGRQIS